MKAHHYKLEIFFSDFNRWDINILATDIKFIECWIPADNSERWILDYSIRLVNRNIAEVYGSSAKGIDDVEEYKHLIK